MKIYQAIDPVVFHRDAPAFSPSVLPIRNRWPDLPLRSDTSHVSPVLTKTAAPNPNKPVAVRSGKRNSNCAVPTDSQTASPSPPANQYSDVALVEIIGESYRNSDYVESAKKLPTDMANTLDLAGHISELELIHEVAEGELVELARPTVIFSCIDELEILELDNTETDPPENHQDNVATPPVNTQPSLLHSPLEDASVASYAHPPHPRVEFSNAALQAREGDLSYVRLLGADYMLSGVYHVWVHQNSGENLDRGIAEDSKRQTRWNFFVCQPNAMTYLPGKLAKYLWEFFL